MDTAEGVWIAKNASIDRTYPAGIQIRSGVVIGNEASILTHDMTRGIHQYTRMGANSIIDARAIIMPAVTVGANCVIDPGTVVIKDVPARSHMRGNPAKTVPQEPASTPSN
ncbi:MAG: hypothetical protein AAGI28_01210 [Pseudomonadota bacterium]